MKYYFERTIDHLNNEKPILPERVLVLVCPPITKERFEQELKPNPFRFFRVRKKEFVKLQYYRDWEDYHDNTAIHVLKSLYNMQQLHRVRVYYDVIFDQFIKLIQDEEYELFFLIAHHIQFKKVNQIEFADGGVEVSRVLSLLQNLNRPIPPGLMLFVCQLESSKQKLLDDGFFSGAVASADWNIPFEAGAFFIELWTSFFDGKHTLSESYEQAIEQYWNLTGS